jgi:hypothetical protein
MFTKCTVPVPNRNVIVSTMFAGLMMCVASIPSALKGSVSTLMAHSMWRGRSC